LHRNSHSRSASPRRAGLPPTAILLTALLLVGATGRNAHAAVAEAPSIDPTAVSQAIRDAMAAPPRLDAEPLDTEALLHFYELRQFRPAWSGDAAGAKRAALLEEALAHAGDDGLDPADYHVAALASQLAPRTAKAAAALDLLLTDAFLRYAHDLRIGRISPKDVDDEISLPAQHFDAAAALAVALAHDDLAQLLAELPPPEPDYARLKDALRRYRAIAAAGGWPQIPKGDGELRLDRDGDPRLPILRARLAVEDPTLASTPDQARPGDLTAALLRFQARNGLDPDGRIGPRTFAMLNIPAAYRVKQIVANLERWRWLPRPIEKRYIAVNTTDASLQVIENGSPIFVSKVVVGDPKHPSPILRAVVRMVTVNPPWNVPYSIALKEMLPKLRRDPTYLMSQNIVILNGPEGDPYGTRIDWASPASRHYLYRLQQLPGPENSLGSIKLEMPNPFDVYLHDTPARRLFARATRTFSHGCIRVEDALKLASLALGGDANRTLDELNAGIAAGATVHLPVRHPLPAYILYWTAIEDPDGTVEFRQDTYGRDGRMIAALAARGRIAAQPSPHKRNG